jgi:hypothetical protein
MEQDLDILSSKWVMNYFCVATLSASVLVGFESINETSTFMLPNTGLLSP